MKTSNVKYVLVGPRGVGCDQGLSSEPRFSTSNVTAGKGREASCRCSVWAPICSGLTDTAESLSCVRRLFDRLQQAKEALWPSWYFHVRDIAAACGPAQMANQDM
jgi:hypothetical protein